MSKKNTDIEVHAEVVNATGKKPYVLRKDKGSNKDGSAKKKQGSTVNLTEEEAAIYKSEKLI